MASLGFGHVDLSNRNTALASAFVEELSRSGVRNAVISPGSRSTPPAVALWRASGIEVAVAVDERSAAFMALGAASASNHPVVLVCTSGTAAANYHPAVAEADISSVPLIVLTSDRPPELRDNGSGQTIDQVKLFGSAVRWFSEVGTHEADDQGLIHMRSTACRAFALAAGDPRPGPVHLNLSWREPLAPVKVEGAVTATDRLALKGRGQEPLTSVWSSPPQASPDLVDSMAERINAAEEPLIVAGRQRQTELAKPLADLARLLGVPLLAEATSQLRFGPHDRGRVVTDYEAICSPEDPPLTPDLVLRFGEMPTSKNLRIWLGGLGPEVDQIVIDPWHAWNEPTRRAATVVRADPIDLLKALEGRLGTDRHWQWGDFWGQNPENAAPERHPGSLSAEAVHRSVANTYRDGDLVYTNSSMSIRDQEAFLGTGEAEVLFLANRGANGIDGLLASGIGAAWAGGRSTTIITGDLGFQHDLGSLALLDQTDTPVRIIVVNDGGGAIFSRLPQKDVMPAGEFEAIMTTPSRLKIESAAASFGVDYRLVDHPHDLSGQLRAEGQIVIEISI